MEFDEASFLLLYVILLGIVLPLGIIILVNVN